MRSYMLVTVGAALIINFLLGGFLGYIVCRPALAPQELATTAQELATRISIPSRASSSSAVDTTALVDAFNPLLNYKMNAAVMDRKGNVLVWVPDGAGKNHTSLFPQAPSVVKTLARAALAENTSIEQLCAQESDGSSLAVVPIHGMNNQVHGLLYLKMGAPVNVRDYLSSLIGLQLYSIATITPFAAIVGLGFGFLNARRLVQRFKAIADAADAWSRGEFSIVAPDNAEDEVGYLARRLNQMAIELRELVALRQDLAASEERNRLSRELHDTVKQHIFATTMQVGAARMVLDRDVAQARARLVEGERLALAAQHELTALLEQLRPGTYAQDPKRDEDWESTLYNYVANWRLQSGISADVTIGTMPILPGATQQALFRITQEALANVARHSRASRVQVQLEVRGAYDNGVSDRERASVATHQKVKLVIQDDGIGFDLLGRDGGFGLQSMRERTQALAEGTFTVNSQVGHGTCVQVTCRVV